MIKMHSKHNISVFIQTIQSFLDKIQVKVVRGGSIRDSIYYCLVKDYGIDHKKIITLVIS